MDEKVWFKCFWLQFFFIFDSFWQVSDLIKNWKKNTRCFQFFRISTVCINSSLKIWKKLWVYNYKFIQGCEWYRYFFMKSWISYWENIKNNKSLLYLLLFCKNKRFFKIKQWLWRTKFIFTINLRNFGNKLFTFLLEFYNFLELHLNFTLSKVSVLLWKLKLSYLYDYLIL